MLSIIITSNKVHLIKHFLSVITYNFQGIFHVNSCKSYNELQGIISATTTGRYFMRNNQPNNQLESPENHAAKIAVIASAISTLGDGLSTIATTMALQQDVIEDTKDHQNDENNSKQIEQLQKEISQLSKRITKLVRTR